MIYLRCADYKSLGNRSAVNSQIEQSTIEKLPAVLIGQIFSHLGLQELGRGCSVSKTLRGRLKHYINQRVWDKAWLKSWVFGAEKWEKYFGEVGLEPPLPQNIMEILNSPCPFFEGKKVRDTQMLVLVPKKVGGETLNLNKLGELIQNPLNKGHPTRYQYYNLNVQNAHGATGINQSYWVLMTKEVIPGSRGKSYTIQERLVSRKGEGSYRLPGVLEAAVCILMEHVVSGNKLFSCEPWSFTRCYEIVLGYYPVIVGGFGSQGPDFQANSFDYEETGAGALRSF